MAVKLALRAILGERMRRTKASVDFSVLGWRYFGLELRLGRRPGGFVVFREGELLGLREWKESLLELRRLLFCCTVSIRSHSESPLRLAVFRVCLGCDFCKRIDI